MADIVVTIPKAKLAKVEAEERRVQRAMARGETGWRYFWKMRRFPKELPWRVYFLWDGAVRAYHETLFVEVRTSNPMLRFWTNMAEAENPTRIWLKPKIHEIPPIPMKPFRGFRYFQRSANE